MLSIRWETDYAFLIVHYISRQQKLVSVAEIAVNAKVPKQFTAGIASKLAKKGIIWSKEGKTGGYSLARELKDISVYEIVSTFEKDMHIVSCQKDNFTCPLEDNCNHRKFFRNRFSTIISTELKKWSLAEIYEQNSAQ